MILPIKVLEEAIKVRKTFIGKLEEEINNDDEGLALAFVESDLIAVKKEITELKNAVKILYEQTKTT